MPDANSPSIFDILIMLGCLGFWWGAYVLIIKRGFQDKSYGMPIGALCANLAWEGLLEWVFEAPHPFFRIGYLLWFATDLVILFTVIKYGRSDFENAFIRRWLFLLMALGVAAAVVSEWAFMTAYHDPYGTILGWLLDLVIGGSLIGMLLRRRSVRGQSVYIALFILLGNVFGYIQCLTYPMPPPLAPLSLIHGLVPGVFLLNLIYLIMVWQQCRLEGITPWKRF